MSFDIKFIRLPETDQTGSASLTIPTLFLVLLDKTDIKDTNVVFSIHQPNVFVFPSKKKRINKIKFLLTDQFISLYMYFNVYGYTSMFFSPFYKLGLLPSLPGPEVMKQISY